jgi:O-antigen ligase
LNNIAREIKYSVITRFLIATSFLSAIKLDVYDIHVNLSQIVAILALIVYIFRQNAFKNLNIEIRKKFSILVMLYFISNFFSSVFFAVDKYQSLKGTIVILSYVLIYFAVRLYITDTRKFHFSLNDLKFFNILSVLFGLFSMIYSAFLGGQEFIGVSIAHVELGIPSIRSLSFEPNLFAEITAVIGCFYFADYFIEKKLFRKKWFLIATIVAILFSFTRSVYASFFFVLVIFAFMTGGNFIKLSKVLIILFAIIFLSLLVNVRFINNLSRNVLLKLNNIGQLNEGTGLVRYNNFLIGYEGFLRSPLFGTGALSADTRFLNPYTGNIEDYFKGYLGNSFMQALNDTGIIGAIIISLLFIIGITQNYNAYKKNKGKEIKKMALGFLGGNIIIFISSFITSSLWIAFPWVYWGINQAFITYISDNNSRR